MSKEITPHSKTIRNYRVAYSLGGLTLITFFGSILLGFDSLFTLPIFFEGLAPVLTGIGVGTLFFKSIFNINIPVILIDESEIQAKHSYWTQRFAWKKLKQITLYKNRIEVTYRQSDRTDSIKLSYLLRSRYTEIRDALQGVCSHNDVDFMVMHSFQSISNSYGFQNNH